MESGTRMKWVLGGSTVAVVIALGIVVGLLDRPSADRSQVAVVAPRQDSSLSPPNPVPEQSTLPLETQWNGINDINPPDRFASGGVRPGWTVVSKDEIAPERLPPYLETYTDARLVSLASDLAHWGPGYRIVFDIPQTGARLESVIERVESGLAGNISYIGRVDRDDALQRMVVTVGARNAFAFIDSDQGSYEMVGNREFGWLMSTDGMEQHMDYSQPDYYIPDNNPRGES